MTPTKRYCTLLRCLLDSLYLLDYDASNRLLATLRESYFYGSRISNHTSR